MSKGSKQSKAANVLIVHRYFWPDTAPAGLILRRIADEWAGMGHNVTAFTAQPAYKPEFGNKACPRVEQAGDITIRRCRLLPERSRSGLLRMFNAVLFVFQAFFHVVIRRKYDVVQCLTFPPVICGFMLRLASALSGAKFVYHCMDIHPESAAYHGGMKQGGLMYRILRWFDTRTCKRAAGVVVLSDDMAETMRARGVEGNVRVMTNFSIPGSAEHVPAERKYFKPAETFRILFAGNIGRFQALPNIVTTARLLENRHDIHFVFVGEGAAKKGLIEQAGDMLDRNVFFVPHQPVSAANELMQDADLCLVSLQRDIFRVANPCKASSYMSLACPILSVIEPESHLYRATLVNDVGYACELENPELLKDVILRAFDERENLPAMGERAQVFANENLTGDALMPEWRRLITDLCGAPAKQTAEYPASIGVGSTGAVQ